MLEIGQQINIPSILKIGKNEIDNIGQYIKEAGFKKAAVFYSSGIELIFGEKVDRSFSSAGVDIIHRDFIDTIEVDNVMGTVFCMPAETQAIIGIGGGKALDYAKYCAHILAIPFISVPTSASNDGFCSFASSLTKDSKRKSLSATIPYGIIIDKTAISSAPDITFYSGIGDLIAKISAGKDWVDASSKGLSSFNDFAYLVSQNSARDFFYYQNLGFKDHNFIYHLVYSLLMSGVSMEIAKSSRPASGSEHLISHALDQISEKPHMHGIQVGLATYLCCLLQNNQINTVRDFLTNTGFLSHLEKNPISKSEFIEAIKLAPTVKEDFYTVLSESDSIQRALEFIEKDEILIKSLA